MPAGALNVTSKKSDGEDCDTDDECRSSQCKAGKCSTSTKKFSPQAPPFYVAGDDTSTVALSDRRLVAAWGDWRGQGLEHIAWGGYSLP